MINKTQKGFLILADISGFTTFVASTELEHSQLILNDIINSAIKHLTPCFTLAEVEGDAIFVYAPAENFPRREKILEIIESTYYAFRDEKAVFQRIITCGCKACEMISTLDLKFFIHYGDYILNEIAGKCKPLGNSVNIVHRLLKNNIREVTGWKAYSLITKDGLEAVGISPDCFYAHSEEFEHVGEVQTFCANLDKLYKDFTSERKFYLSNEEADLSVEKEFPLPPPLLWEWFNNPKMRSIWMEGSDWATKKRPQGRTAAGATNHCSNTKIIERIMDYRPFEYYTSNLSKGPLNITVTCKFEKIPSGTKVYYNLKLNTVFPKWISHPLGKLLFEKGYKPDQLLDKLTEKIEKQYEVKEKFKLGNN